MRTLVHISDTHILPTPADRLQGVDTLRTLEQVLEYASSSGIRPDALIVSGDLANAGELASYQRLRPLLERATSEWNAELVVAMGNHDARGPFRQGMLDGPPSSEPVEYVRWIGGLRLIVLDSTVPFAAYGEVRADQLDWLRSSTPQAGLLTLHGKADLESTISGTVEQRTLRGVEGSGFGLVRVFDGQMVSLTVAMPSDGRQTYHHELDEKVLSRLNGESVALA
jgi:3',5'-cyclic AMP phosphodiesterase CpdA